MAASAAAANTGNMGSSGGVGRAGRIPRPVTTRTAAAHKAAFLVAAAARRGHGAAWVCARYGLDPSVLADVDGRVPLDTVCRMWDELPALLGDADLPLTVLEVAREADPPLPVWLFLTAPSLGEALERMRRYERVGFDVADEPVSRLRRRGDEVHLELDVHRCAVPPPAGAVAQTVAALVALARAATGASVTPRVVELRYPEPRRRGPWEAALGPGLRFGARRDRVIWARVDLDRRHLQASRTLSTLAVRHAETALAALPQGGDVLADVRRVVRLGLPDGPVPLSAVAARLRTSERTLQRRLSAAGTSWRDVLDGERREVALRHLEDPRSRLVDVALAAGFADASAFGRAFRRWTGEAPAAWRVARRHQGVARPVERGAPASGDAPVGGGP